MLQNKVQSPPASPFGTGSGDELSPFKVATVRHGDEDRISTVAHRFRSLPLNIGSNRHIVLFVAFLCNVAVASCIWYLVGLVIG